MKDITKTNCFYDSSNPLVDGTNLTDNKNIIDRRKRKISEVGKIHSNCKVKEFLTLCKFLAGECDEPLEKPSMSHINILACVRNNNYRYINKSIEAVINDNLDLVIKASTLKKSEIFEKYKKLLDSKNAIKVTAEKFKKTGVGMTFNEKLENLVKNKNNSINNDNINNNNVNNSNNKRRISKSSAISGSVQLFMTYLNQILDPTIIISKKNSYYHIGIVSSLNDTSSGARALYIDEIVDKYRETLRKTVFIKHRKVDSSKNFTWKKIDTIFEHIASKINIENLDECYIKKDESENYLLFYGDKIKLAKLDKSFKIIEIMQKEVEKAAFIEKEESTIENTQIEKAENIIIDSKNSKDEQDKNMLSFIKSIRELGVKEITIKF